MSNTPHTEAPWDYFFSSMSKFREFSYHIFRDPNKFVATVYGSTPEESMANAMLISASPELLSACEFGNMGMQTIVLLHNAANVLEELGREKGLVGPMQLAASLRKKGEMEFAAVEKAVRARTGGKKL